jgi:hypothetical protein
MFSAPLATLPAAVNAMGGTIVLTRRVDLPLH